MSKDKEKNPNDKVVSMKNVKKLKGGIDYPNTCDGKILDTANNLKFLLDLHFIKVRWNSMLRVREVTIPGVDHFVDEKENADLAHIYHLATTSRMPNKTLDKHLDSIAWNKAYHPVVESLASKPWDGVARMDNFIATLKTKDQEFSYSIIRRWMISAIAACHSKTGFSAQGVLVLQGIQNLGKTRWVKSLDPIGCGAVQEALIIDPSNKDSVITASQCWIAELGELDATFKKADIARLKSFITNSVDIVRFPYNARNSYLNRRSVFVATVNDSEFLVDDTGNRRWWTIEVESIDFSQAWDMQQVWAEVYHIWKTENEKTWLSETELHNLNKVNEQHELIDPYEEKFLALFDFHPGWEQQTTIKMTTTEVLEKLGYDKPNKSDVTRMGKIIIKHTGFRPKKSNLRYHALPTLTSNFGFSDPF
jgi:putative DNA primase/helicase